MKSIRQDATAKRRPTAFGANPEEVASLPGLEPGTYCLEGSCSVQLSYRDKPAVPHNPSAEDIPTHSPHRGFLRVHCNTSLMPQQVHGTPETNAGLGRSLVSALEGKWKSRAKRTLARTTSLTGLLARA
jgi:hypothetical protein